MRLARDFTGITIDLEGKAFFYVRVVNSTEPLDTRQTIEYSKNRF